MQTALALRSGLEYIPVLFFDDSKDLHGTNVAGLRVYNPDDAMEIMAQFECVDLLLAIPSAPRSKKFSIIQRFEGNGIRLKTIPGLGELVSGSVKVDDIREVGIEDLLGRDPVPPFQNLIGRCVTGKVVMVTGAGGSIGSELCRQILNLQPKKIILFERSEFHLYQIESELTKLALEKRGSGPAVELISVLGDVLRYDPLFALMQKHQVQTVYHAAAYKHVPLVEMNEVAGVHNNVIGTYTCAQAAKASGVESFVLISTDKAVRPTNVMGASKRFAEMSLQMLAQEQALQSLNQGGASVTNFAMVRFGNVLGSSGSVVPLFREQIKNGGPVTVTHAEMTRYFMTIPEAALLVIQAGAMSAFSKTGAGQYSDSKSGQVYLLDMGEPVKIMDLARKMIELSGFSVRNSTTGEGDIAIEVIGLRPAEKLYEELLIDSNAEKTEHPRIMKASEPIESLETVKSALQEAEKLIQKHDALGLRNLLQKIVVEYKPKN